MAITPLPTPVPQRSDPANFATRADAFLTALPTFGTEANALAVEVNAYAISADIDATTATTKANAAAASANLAAANAAFKGDWSSLTGAAAIPFSVYHISRFWMLRSNIADITTKIPGTAAEWAEVSPPAASAVSLNYALFGAL